MRSRTAIGSMLVYATAILVALTSVAIGQEKTGPRLKCSTEIFDFGYVPQGVTVSHTYWLRNSGSETVNIKQIKPNCGCTQVPPTDSTIAVGDSLPVEILFGTRNITGKVEKFTRIISNAEGRVPALTFRAMVFKDDAAPFPVTATPAIVKLGTATTGKVVLSNMSKNPVRVSVIDIPPGFIHLSVNELSLAPNESKELGFDLLPQQKQGDFTKSITLETNNPAKTRITIPVTNVQKE